MKTCQNLKVFNIDAIFSLFSCNIFENSKTRTNVHLVRARRIFKKKYITYIFFKLENGRPIGWLFLRLRRAIQALTEMTQKTAPRTDRQSANKALIVGWQKM